MTESVRPAWKGLDTSRMPVFIGYDQVERMVAALLERAAAWAPDAVVGLARGGVVPAAMAAGILALPLSFVGHDKTTDAIDWIGPPATGRRICWSTIVAPAGSLCTAREPRFATTAGNA